MAAWCEGWHHNADQPLAVSSEDPLGFLLIQLNHHVGACPQLAGLQHWPVVKLQLQGPLPCGDLASRLGAHHAELWLLAPQLITELLRGTRWCHLLQQARGSAGATGLSALLAPRSRQAWRDGAD